MLTDEEATQQQQLLITYRRNLSVLLLQAAQYGGESAAPLPVLNNITEARDNIQRIKDILRTSGIAVDNHPDDLSPVRRALDQAVAKQAPQVEEHERSQVLRRAQFAAAALQGAQALWVDDHPSNNINERRILRTFGIFIDLARSSDEAIEMLQQVKYDLVISDMGRDGVRDEGLKFLDAIIKQNLYRPTIFYTVYGPSMASKAQKAFAITNRPDYLLHYVIDVLERERI